MLTAYIQAPLRHAHYPIIDDPKPFYGSIAECQGVWAAGETLEGCREELQSVLEDWIVLGLRLGHPMPVIDGISVAVEKLEAKGSACVGTFVRSSKVPDNSVPFANFAVS